MVEHSLGGRHLGAEARPDVVAAHEPRRVVRPKPKPRAVRMLSPPMLPPTWGQAVAPPPTPHFTPQTSPRSALLGDENQMEVYLEEDERGPDPRLPSLLEFHEARTHDSETLDRRALRHRRSHRRLRRVRSSASTSSRCSSMRCPNLCHGLEETPQELRRADTVLYAYTFDGDVIDRRPIVDPLSDLGVGSHHHRVPSRRHVAADVIHRFHHPHQDFNADIRASGEMLFDQNSMDYYDDDRATVVNHRGRLHHVFRGYEVQTVESRPVEIHRPPHNSLSSSPLGGATTGSGSISPDVSPILNLGDNVTRLTTSPATPPRKEVHTHISSDLTWKPLYCQITML